jgi:hydrogenase-4 component B
MTGPGTLLIVASMLAALSGVPILLPGISAVRGQRISAASLAAAALAGVGASLATLVSGETDAFILPWSLPFGPLEAALDPLSALFLIPVFLVSGCIAVYGLRYWPAADNPRTIRKLTLFLGLLTASMAWVILARDAILFLFAWEIMALSAWFVLTTEDDREAVRDAGLLYMVTTHVSTLALFGLFAMLAGATGTFLFPAAGSLPGTGSFPAILFAVALVGFGLKAGLMPFHVWLPSAHANAPSHVSAVMSGVILKIGVYGMVRTLSFFGGIPAWWGIVLLCAGIVSGVAGVAFAIAQHDLKRLLAYHSIENVGIIFMGIGVALVGQATGNGTLALLGMAGALLHVVNHSTFKALLFLCAGSAVHAAGTREIDRMGGLARRIPWAARFFVVGAVAICGLPPLNGFVSELLVYLGLFGGVTGKDTQVAAFAALAAPSLALVGGLATACFVKVYGVAFLGEPRVPFAGEAHREPLETILPMGLLALVCAVVGLVPLSVAPLLDAAAASWLPALGREGRTVADVAPLGWVTALNLALAAGTALSAWLLMRWVRARGSAQSETWGCGYLAPTPRIQYTASSFGEMLTGFFGGILRPHAEARPPAGAFPGRSRFGSHVPEAVLELVYLPLLERANARLSVIRRMQSGRIHIYILYVFATLVLLLGW